jgi:hypothetical protein
VFLPFSEIRTVRDEQKKKWTLRSAIQSVVAAGKLERLGAVIDRRTKRSTDDRYIHTSSSANHWHTNIPVCN